MSIAERWGRNREEAESNYDYGNSRPRRQEEFFRLVQSAPKSLLPLRRRGRLDTGKPCGKRSTGDRDGCGFLVPRRRVRGSPVGGSPFTRLLGPVWNGVRGGQGRGWVPLLADASQRIGEGGGTGLVECGTPSPASIFQQIYFSRSGESYASWAAIVAYLASLSGDRLGSKIRDSRGRIYMYSVAQSCKRWRILLRVARRCD